MTSPSPLARDLRSIPNIITLSRIALLLSAVPCYLYVSRAPGLFIASLAGLTDYVDGIVARRTGQVTRLGEILDQFSDLVFESFSLLIAVVAGFVPVFVLMLYLARELWVSSIRRFMAGEQLNIASNLTGKLKTNVLMWSLLPAFISISGLAPGGEPWLTAVGRAGLGLGLVLSYVSGIDYTRQFAAGYARGAVAGQRDESRET